MVQIVLGHLVRLPRASDIEPKPVKGDELGRHGAIVGAPLWRCASSCASFVSRIDSTAKQGAITVSANEHAGLIVVCETGRNATKGGKRQLRVNCSTN